MLDYSEHEAVLRCVLSPRVSCLLAFISNSGMGNGDELTKYGNCRQPSVAPSDGI